MSDAHDDLEVMCYNTEERCTNVLTYEDDYVGMARKKGLEGKALRLKCDECGEYSLVCPVCHGEGWYRGESTGDMLACHCCNAKEAARQRRSAF